MTFSPHLRLLNENCLYQHANEKLKSSESIKLKITKRKINLVLKNSETTNLKLNPHRKTGGLNNDLSLCVIYKIEGDITKVVTFYPAKKGRYESKI